MQIKIPMNFVLNKGNGLDIMKTSHEDIGVDGTIKLKNFSEIYPP